MAFVSGLIFGAALFLIFWAIIREKPLREEDMKAILENHDFKKNHEHKGWL